MKIAIPINPKGKLLLENFQAKMKQHNNRNGQALGGKTTIKMKNRALMARAEIEMLLA